MRFRMIDSIRELEVGTRILATKRLLASEDYLRDHFPRFPVMPGVLMLEGMYQSSAWLVRATDHFRHSLVLLKEARNVKYAGFVEPGQELWITAEVIKHEESTTTLKCQGSVGERVAVSARLVLERFNLGDRWASRAATDGYTIRQLRGEFERLLEAGGCSQTCSSHV